MFDSLFADIDSQEREFTVYQSGEETEVESQFETHNVAVSQSDLPPEGPEPFLVIEDEKEFAGALPVAELDRLLEPPVVRPGEREDVSKGFGVLFEVLDETVFRSMDRAQLLAVSREIEDRAARVGEGTLRVRFESRSVFEPQTALYRELAAETELDIHVYGIDDQPLSGVQFHRREGFDSYWVLAFDGGPDKQQACALLARRQGTQFEGFWTYDPELVDRIMRPLAE